MCYDWSSAFISAQFNAPLTALQCVDQNQNIRVFMVFN